MSAHNMPGPPTLPPLLANGGCNEMVRGRHGFVVYNRNDIVLGRSASLYGEYFESEVEVFRSVLRPGAVVADIGANIGMHTLALARIVGPTGWVYAFEPQRQVHQILCANIAVNSLTMVDCEQMALGDTVGEITIPEVDMTVEGNFGGLSAGHEDGRLVRLMTLDAYLDESPVALLKIDIEGMEAACIRGATATIRRCKPVIYVEADRPAAAPELIELLWSMGYDLYWHLPQFFNAANFAGCSENIHPPGFYDTGEPGADYFGSIGFAINLLCFPRAHGVKVNGLLKVEDPHEHPLRKGPGRFHP